MSSNKPILYAELTYGDTTVKFSGTRISSGAYVTDEGITGWYSTPDAKWSLTERSYSDGAFPIEDDYIIYSTRTITASIGVVAPNRSTLLDTWSQILACAHHECKFRVVDADSDTYVYGYSTVESEATWDRRWNEGTLTIVCSDPRRLSTAGDSCTLQPSQVGVTGGLSYGNAETVTDDDGNIVYTDGELLFYWVDGELVYTDDDGATVYVAYLGYETYTDGELLFYWSDGELICVDDEGELLYTAYLVDNSDTDRYTDGSLVFYWVDGALTAYDGDGSTYTAYLGDDGETYYYTDADGNKIELYTNVLDSSTYYYTDADGNKIEIWLSQQLDESTYYYTDSDGGTIELYEYTQYAANGLVYDLTYGDVSSETGTTGTVTNNGSAVAYPIVTAYGQFDEGLTIYMITGGDRYEVSYDANVSGTPIIFDYRTRQVTCAGLDRSMHLTAREFAGVAPGSSANFNLQADGSGYVEVEIHDTYI